MKKVISICLLSIICIAFCSCGNSSGLTDSETKAALSAIEITDNYLDYSISKKDACGRLEEIEDRLSQIEVKGDSSRELSLTTISIALDKITWELTANGGDDATVLECRNDIADVIGKNRR